MRQRFEVGQILTPISGHPYLNGDWYVGDYYHVQRIDQSGVLHGLWYETIEEARTSLGDGWHITPQHFDKLEIISSPKSFMGTVLSKARKFFIGEPHQTLMESGLMDDNQIYTDDATVWNIRRSSFFSRSPES